MKFSSAVVFSLCATATTPFAAAFQSPAFTARRSKLSTPSKSSLLSTTQDAAASEVDEETQRRKTKKDERLRIMKKDNFHRKGFKEVREQAESMMTQQFQSDLVKDMRESNYVIEKDGVKVYLAKDFGFCWGVERSIALAYEAVDHFPGKKIHLTNDLIHNPEVNDILTSRNIEIMQAKADGSGKPFENVKDGDVVIFPAFGASLEEMDRLDNMGVEIVDTTCPWVSKVWNAVDKHQREGLTSIIHGKYAHEETVATISFCEDYICVKDMKEAEMVVDYIVNGGDKEAFLKYFEKAISKGFDPDVHLKKVGLANQTTMYKKETRAIGQMLQKAMMKKYGPVDAKKHYMEFDTICDATQERQDAVSELVENAQTWGLDFILVIGGWDSSNTAHLLEIPHHAGVRSFHINKASCIGADNTITHRLTTGEIVTEPFILDLNNEKEVVMGVTSGASTPDAAIQDSLSSIFLLKKLAATN